MMTLLKAWTRLTKLHQHDGVQWNTSGYGRAEWFQMRTMRVDSLQRLADILGKIEWRSDICVIRGTPISGVDLDRCQRHYKKAPVTVQASAPQWLMVDVDGMEEPAGSDMISDPGGCVEHVLGLLPEEFQDVSCYWQASASAGIKPGIRLHLWFWLSRPVDDAEAKGWLKQTPADRTIYNPIQVHYTAHPLFMAGSVDPMRRRSGFRMGLDDTVEVPEHLERVEAEIDGDAVELAGSEPDLRALQLAVEMSRSVRDIWTGKRIYKDRSKGHFALGCALARAGVRDPDTIVAALRAYDEQRELSTDKIDRRDYAELTVGRCLARAK